MKNAYGPVAFVTGASSGIGKSTAELLAENGMRVYGTSRRGGERRDFGAGFVEMLKLDVTDDASVRAATDEVFAREGHIDVLINCAGTGVAGAVEDCAASDALVQLNANYLGVLRMIRAVLPSMREQRNGLIVNIGSVGGIFSLPFQTLYSSSKFAVEALTEGLRTEIAPFGVKAALVEPGDVKTGFTGARVYASGCPDTAYADGLGRAVGKMAADERNGIDPIRVARVVKKLIGKKHPPVRVTVGFVYKCLVFLKRVLPARTVVWILGLMYAGAKRPAPDVWSMDDVRNSSLGG